MNIFNELKKYATGYELVNSRGFNATELSQFASAKVVASEYGMSVCFYMVSGGKTYIPVSRDSICNIGDTVDASKAKILTLEKDGNRINRIEI